MGIFGFFNKEKKETLDKGLEKTKTSVFDKLTRAVAGKSKVDDDVLDNLEEVLITSDVGVDTTLKIIKRIEERVARDKYVSTSELNRILRDEIANLLAENNTEDNDNWDLPGDHKPYVILVVGVNGVGKTTSIAKISSMLKSEGKKVVLAAADTFRAAATEQLTIWAERVGVDIIKGNEGSDPAAVVFDAASAAKKRHADVLIIDTAGRLHNKKNLMDELGKINRVVDRELPDCVRETLLVLDATTGQNAVIQAKEFENVAELTGIILTKLDGTAKGGIVFSIREELGVPVKYIGVGEKADDFQKFDPDEFVSALFGD
jgi:fused signal recognition particle receptor